MKTPRKPAVSLQKVCYRFVREFKYRPTDDFDARLAVTLSYSNADRYGSLIPLRQKMVAR